MQNINSRIVAIREANNMKQKDFSEKTGIPRSSLSEIENGKRSPSVDFIIGISNQFKDINTDWLLTGSGNMYRQQPEELTVSSTNRRLQMMLKIMEALPENEQDKILSSAEDKKFIYEMKQREIRQSA